MKGYCGRAAGEGKGVVAFYKARKKRQTDKNTHTYSTH